MPSLLRLPICSLLIKLKMVRHADGNEHKSWTGNDKAHYPFHYVEFPNEYKVLSLILKSISSHCSIISHTDAPE